MLAKLNPAGSVDTPFALVEEKLLTRGEKIAMLNRWQKTILTSEHGTTEGRDQLLAQVEEAKVTLGLPTTTNAGPLRRI